MDILIIFILLIFSAFFSGAETAFFSLTKIHIKQLEKENNARAKRILSLLQKPKQLLIIVLLGNTIVNVVATAMATLYALKISTPETKSLIMTSLIVIMTTLLLIFGEIIPKLFAFTTPVRIASFTSFILIAFKCITYPIIKALDWFTSSISRRKDTLKPAATSFSREEIQNIVQSESSTHLLEENERKIIDSIFRFSSTSVKEIMVPRVDIVGVEVSCSITEAKAIIVDSGYSRIPVYKKTIDEIIGMIYAKDLILYPEKSSLMALQRKVSFIPQNMKIQTLLTQFQSRKKQIAIVVDEYGGTSGLVTLEDILEELVGEIMDEYDEEQPMVTRINDATHLISGMIQVAELNRQFDLNLDEDFDNLADFLFSELNHIPHRNERFLYKDQVEFVISHIKKQRIGYVRMRIIKQKEES